MAEEHPRGAPRLLSLLSSPQSARLTHASLAPLPAAAQTRSPRSLRKLLLAFRSAAQSGNNDDEGVDVRGAGERYRIVDPKVFEKVVTTALKYTPVVLQTYSPYKEVAGK